MRDIPREDLLAVVGCEIDRRPDAPGISELEPHLLAVKREPGALVATFQPAAASLVEAFAAAERVCCSGLSWEVAHRPATTLRIATNEGALDAIEELWTSSISTKLNKEVTAMTTEQGIKTEVRKRYGNAAKRVQEQSNTGGCCGSSVDDGVITSNLYATDELQHLPQEAVVASLGCGNPVAVAELKAGETVLDLGSGGGIDVLLSARRVGPTGKAYGLDMTDEMLDLARENQAKAGVSNVEFLRGEMENIPLPRNTVDVIISNCVVNLSPNKDAVLAEAFRVLKPGGRVAIADIVTKADLPAPIKESMALWTGCIAGALAEDEYREKLANAGFEDVDIESFREYTAEDAASGGLGEKAKELGAENLGIFSAVVRARKPANAELIPLSDVGQASAVGNSCGDGSCC